MGGRTRNSASSSLPFEVASGEGGSLARPRLQKLETNGQDWWAKWDSLVLAIGEVCECDDDTAREKNEDTAMFCYFSWSLTDNLRFASAFEIVQTFQQRYLLTGRPWQVNSVDVCDATGVTDGFQWIVNRCRWRSPIAYIQYKKCRVVFSSLWSVKAVWQDFVFHLHTIFYLRNAHLLSFLMNLESFWENRAWHSFSMYLLDVLVAWMNRIGLLFPPKKIVFDAFTMNII